MVLSRRETEVVELGEISMLQEPSTPYGQKRNPENAGNVIL